MTGDNSASWRVAFDLPDGACVSDFDAALEPLGGAITAREIDNGPRWRMIAHVAEAPDRAWLEARIAVIAASQGIELPAIAIEPLPATDWVEEYRRRTPPVTVGRFFIYPSHYTGDVPAGKTGIRLDAGLAFGTGEHQTTAGCLQALEKLHGEGLSPGRVLDMGCGSAILAIAASRLWPGASVLAVDNDPDAVLTAQDNLADNGCADTVRAVVGDGYRTPAVTEGAPFGLIVANILAGPLIAMVPEAAEALARGGRLILSGLLTDQADAVLAAHENSGFVLRARIDIENWTTLIVAPAG